MTCWGKWNATWHFISTLFCWCLSTVETPIERLHEAWDVQSCLFVLKLVVKRKEWTSSLALRYAIYSAQDVGKGGDRVNVCVGFIPARFWTVPEAALKGVYTAIWRATLKTVKTPFIIWISWKKTPKKKKRIRSVHMRTEYVYCYTPNKNIYTLYCVYIYIYIYIHTHTHTHTGAGHIIRISSKSWFISLIPFKKWNLYNVYIHSTQTDIFQVFISFNFDDYYWQLMKTPNSVSQKIRILWTNFTVCSLMKVNFCISFGNQGPRVWRKRGEAQNPRCLRSSVKFPQSVMVWGAMSSAGFGVGYWIWGFH